MPTFDPISGAPISSLGTYLNQEITQTLNLSDSLGLLVDHNLSIDHTLTLTSSVGLSTELNHSLSDTLTVSDAINVALDIIRSLSDSVTLSHSLGVQFIDNTEPYETLNLSHSVSVNAIRTFSFDHDLFITDIGLRVLQEDVIDTLLLSHTLEKFVPEFYITHTLSLVHLGRASGNFSMSLIDTLSLSHFAYRSLFQNINHSITFTNTIDNRLIPKINVEDTLNLTQSIEGLVNLETNSSGNLQLNHSVVFDLFAQQNIIQALNILQSLDMFNLAVQNLANDLTLVGDLTYTLFEQQDMIQILVFGHVIDNRNLQIQGNPNTLTLSHSVSVSISIAGEQNTENNLNLRQSVGLNQVKYFEICDCIHMTDSVHKAIELDVEHSLNLNQNFIPGQPSSDLILSQDLSINVTIDECCGHVFVQDKLVKNSLSLNHSVTLNQDSIAGLTGTLTLSHTAAYYVL